MVQPISTPHNIRLSRVSDMEAFGMLSLDDMQAVCNLLVQRCEVYLDFHREWTLEADRLFNVTT